MDELDSIIHLTDETGESLDFEFLDLIEYAGKEFVVLLPCDQGEDEIGEVVILQYDDSEDEDSESYISVEDDYTLNTVFEIFKEKFKEEFSFLDE